MSESEGGRLLRRVGLSMFWNASLLPLITLFNLASALLIRRTFALESGLYDVLIGLVNSLVFWASVGLPDTLTLFVPQLEKSGWRDAIRTFLRRTRGVSLLALATLLVPFNLFAGRVAEAFPLGSNGVVLVYLVSGLAVLRALNNLQVKGLQGLLEHRGANLLQLLLAVLTALALVLTFVRGLQMDAVLVVLIATTALTLLPGVWWTRRALAEVPDDQPPAAECREFSPGIPSDRFWRFSLFMYGYSWFDYFVRPAFASPAIIAATGSYAAVALFNVAYQIPFMTIVLIVSSFTGLYRPMFARLLGDADRLRTGFLEVSKLQIALLLPAGAGLAVMCADYIPLLFGSEFAGAVPMARALCVLLFAETMLNLGSIILTVDHRYREASIAMSMRLAVMPAFVWFAARDQLLAATIVFGLGRVLSVAVGYGFCRRAFDVRFPIAFLLRALPPTVIMVALLSVARLWLPTSAVQAVGLTVLGSLVVVLTTRWFRVLTHREADLLRRAGIPGNETLVRLLVPEPRGGTR